MRGSGDRIDTAAYLVPYVGLGYLTGYSWYMPECPLCGCEHHHGGGGRDSDPLEFLGGRAPHCYWGDKSPEYRLVDADPARTLKVIALARGGALRFPARPHGREATWSRRLRWEKAQEVAKQAAGRASVLPRVGQIVSRERAKGEHRSCWAYTVSGESNGGIGVREAGRLVKIFLSEEETGLSW